MATQGMVTVRRKNQVEMKIVVGCDGMLAKRLAKALKKRGKLPSAREVYRMAAQIGFGCRGCLAVITAGKIVHKFKDDLPEAYVKTLNDPTFNPRWEQGTADHTEIVDL